MYKTLQQERMMEKRKHVTLYFDLGLSMSTLKRTKAHWAHYHSEKKFNV